MPDGPLLRQVRNQLGPNWLRTFILSPDASNVGTAVAQKVSALEPLSIETVQALLANCDESCSASRIGFYPDVQSLVEKVRSSKCWAEGEVFVAAESADRYVIMKQVAPASCEMMTLTNSGFLDVYTAYRMDAAELIDVLNGAMSKNSAAGDRPRA